MRKVLFAAVAALSLSGCAALGALGSLPTSPVAVADTTALDETVAIAVELAYKAWRTAVEAGTDAGWFTGDKATRIAALDRQAYDATRAVRAAYDAGNAADYRAAAAAASAALANATAALGR